jgi:hypothetical protein
MAEGVKGRDERAGDWNGQLARFVHWVSSNAEAQRPLDGEEEEALELLVRALVGAGSLRAPRQGTWSIQRWASVSVATCSGASWSSARLPRGLRAAL